MTRNAHADFCLSVQALRRYVDGVRTPLATAIGVAASLYTHQLANVERVLTDIRVRHLLADEVGLGKTVQALMILNALRCQRSDLTAIIIVPDRLVSQWRDEILTRAHSAPFDGNSEAEAGQYIRLAWEDQLRQTGDQGTPRLTLADIDPEKFDVLVVDELHRLRADLQDRIVRVAAGFEHLLVLTATPALQHVDRHAQLFALLEPERTAIAQQGVASGPKGQPDLLAAGGDLSKWPEWAAQAVVDDLLARDRVAAESSGEPDRTATAMASCAYRRFIRTRRADYSKVLPRRRHCPMVIEPLGAEVERQSLMWQYFSYLGDLSRRLDPILLAKRVILSPPSLEQRVDFLRRSGHERGNLLERVKPLVDRRQGDSRADALVDLLAEVWSRDPNERVLVAAQDNLTVDYLFKLVKERLPVIGPLNERVPLVAARVRQGRATEAVEDLGGFGNETNENLEEFQRGYAQVLFAPEAAQVGLNLQCARVLVLYSVPWRPQEVEQWIGRLDRIGNVSAFSNEGDARTIDVYTIAQRGLVDEKVVTVLKRFHVFEHSVNLDGNHLEKVASLIELAALRSENISWHDLEEETEAMAAEDEVQELASPLRRHLPWTARTATDLRQYLDDLAPTQPVLRKQAANASAGPRSWDRAFEEMLKLLRCAGDYHIRLNTDPTGGLFQTLWYCFGAPGMYGGREILSKVVFSFGVDPSRDRSPRGAFAFVTRRGDIGTPPRREVTFQIDGLNERKPLRFLSFGDALHDEMLKGWMPDGSCYAYRVDLFDDHVFWRHGNRGIYLVRASTLDPAYAINNRKVKEQAWQAIESSATRTSEDRLSSLLGPFLRQLRSAIEADVRWVRGQLAATLILDVRKAVDQRWLNAADEEIQALLNPLAHGRKGLPAASDLYLTQEEKISVATEFVRVRATGGDAARTTWSHLFPNFDRALDRRLCVIRGEARDAVAVAENNLRSAEKAFESASERGNRAQISRAENECNFAADAYKMTEAIWQERARWLSECRSVVRELLPKEKLSAILRVCRAH